MATQPDNLKIVLDHSGVWTFGDRAQTEAAIASWKRQIPGCRITMKLNPIDVPMDYGQDATYISPRVDLESPGRVLGWLQKRRGCWGISQRLLPLHRFAVVLTGVWGAFTRRWLGFALIPSGVTREFINTLAGADAFVISGNGGINDTFRVGGLLSYGMEVLVARALGKPVVMTGQGIGPLSRPGWRHFAALFLRCARYIGTREAISIDVLRKLGISMERCQLSTDDAHVYAGTPEMAGRVEAFLAGLRRPVITFNMRDEPYVSLPPEFLPVVARTLDRVIERTDASVVCVPMQTEVARDQGVYRRLLDAMIRKDRACLLPDDLTNPGAVKLLQTRIDAAVGCTYHFLLFALSAEAPALGIYFNDYYWQKFVGLMDQYHMQDGVMAGAGLTAEALEARIIWMLEHRTTLSQTIARRNRELAARHADTYRRAASLVIPGAQK